MPILNDAFANGKPTNYHKIVDEVIVMHFVQKKKTHDGMNSDVSSDSEHIK